MYSYVCIVYNSKLQSINACDLTGEKLLLYSNRIGVLKENKDININNVSKYHLFFSTPYLTFPLNTFCLFSVNRMRRMLLLDQLVWSPLSSPSRCPFPKAKLKWKAPAPGHTRMMCDIPPRFLKHRITLSVNPLLSSHVGIH